MNTTEIKVENLKCNDCASTIKKGVEKYEEVFCFRWNWTFGYVI